MKGSFFRGWKKVFSLYIPHGSDESAWCGRLFACNIASLYPTWFRWKAMDILTKELDPLTLYPTWFRWKQVKEGHRCELYVNFISHMVQMKAMQRIDRKRYVDFALYPTWFRWKRDSLFIYHAEFRFISHMVQMKAPRMGAGTHKDILYIPHGSDESQIQITICQ